MITENTESAKTRLHLGLLAGLCAALFLLNAWSLPLADPEEARCAVIARTMMTGGDWIVPHLDGKIYADKPAPFFWLVAAGWKITGSPELGGRMIPALAGLLAVLVTYFVGRRIFGPTAGLIAGLVLATSGEFAYMARWYRMDMPFVAGMWAAIWWFWRSEARRHETGTSDRTGWYGFYAFCGVATVFKGPAGLLLPMLVVGAYLLLSGKWTRIFEMVHVGGVLVYLAIASPWYVAMTWRDPHYPYEFFVKQNLVRYGGETMGSHKFSGILYVPILLAGMLPWTALLPAACLKYFPRRFRDRMREPGVMLMWLAALIPLLFFSFSKTKLVGYILPVFSPLAVLVGAALAAWVLGRQRDRLMSVSVGVWLASMVLMTVVLAGLERWLGALDWWFVIPAAMTTACVGAGWWYMRSGRRSATVAILGVLVTGVCLYLIMHTAPAGYEKISTRDLALRVSPQDAQTCVFCFPGGQKKSFEFYADPQDDRKVHWSSKKEADKDWDGLTSVMNGDKKAYCVIENKGDLAALKQKCPAANVVAESGGRWLVVNRPPAASER